MPVGEVDSAYQANSKIKRVTRADRIDVTLAGALVRRYDLTYEAGLSSASKSRLASLQECAGATPDCFPATTFTYQNGTVGLNAEVSAGISVPAASKPRPLDVNGDGRQDLVYPSSTTPGAGTWMVAFANGSGGYNAATNTGIANTNWNGATPIDYNADGLHDLLVPYSGGTWWVMLGTTSGFATPINTSIPATATGTGDNARAIDIDGDGLEDLVWADLVGYAGGDAIRYRLRVLAGTFSATVYTLAGPLPADEIFSNVFGWWQFYPQSAPDFNGDGRGDFAYRHTLRSFVDGPNTWNYNRSIITYRSGGSVAAFAMTAGGGDTHYGDFNGDGLTDILYTKGGTTSTTRVRFSTGTSFTAEIVALTADNYSTPYYVLDWDADRYDDFLIRNNTTGNWEVVRSTGEAFAAPVNTGIAFGSGSEFTVTDVNGDGLQDFARSVSGAWHYRTHAGNYPDVLLSVTDGFGNSSSFSYVPLTQSNYTKYTDATFPEQDYQGPTYVVGTLTAPTGISSPASFTQSFWYYGARKHLQGRGFEGFYARRTQDSRNSLYAYQYYHRLFPYTGAVFQSDLYQSNGSTLISRVQNTWNRHLYGAGYELRSLPFPSQSTQTRYEVGGSYDGSLVSTAVTTRLVDSATGTLYDSTTTTTEAASANGVQAGAQYTQRVYQTSLSSDLTNWCIGRPGQVQQISSHNQYGGSSITRTTNLTWDTIHCRVSQTVTEQGDGQLQVTRALGYDGFGNLNSDSITGAGMSARTTTATWGTDGRFPSSVTNALSQQTQFTWNATYGVPASQTDPNGIVISWQQDPFGRRTRESRPDGTATTWSYDECTSSGCVNAQNKMLVVETSLDTGGSFITDRRLYTDRLDRPIATSARTLSGAYNRTSKEYDALGRVARESAPCWWSACSLYWTSFTYDAIDRVTQVSRPVSDSNPALQTTSAYHEGLTTRTIDALSKQTTKVANVTGGLARSIDHDSYYQSFDYDPFGNLLRATDSLSNTLQSNTFNVRGMRTAQSDMSAGSWTYVPNALGEVVSQTDAKSQQTTFGYDALGRMTSRAEFEGTTSWTWGTSSVAKNIGRLGSVAGPGYSESYSYDSIGRLLQKGISSDATYYIDYAYNSVGAVGTLTYPTSTSGYRLKLQYDYQNGSLLRVRDYNAPATVFWTGNDMDARGAIVSESLGNGIQTVRGYDAVTGWLDYIQSSSGSGAIQDLSYTWDGVGNLTQRQDVRQSLIENLYYDNLHRLSSTTGPDPNASAYDGRGNLISRTGAVSSGNSHTITWYSYNLPKQITSGSSMSLFSYAPDRARWKQLASYAGTAESTTYIGGLIEKVTLGTVTSWKHVIAGGTGTVAVYTRKSDGTNAIHYLTKDHLGSIDSISNASGTIEVRLAFGAFGQRRKEAGWSGNPTSGDWTQITNTTRHGFTEHEMLDNLNLVHMNGRVYDQLVGSFVSPDPYIDGPGSTQGWNRYSYVRNNPLSFVDPSGYSRLATVRPPNGNEPGADAPSGASFGNGGAGYGGGSYGGGAIETVTVTGSRLSDLLPTSVGRGSSGQGSGGDGIGGGGGRGRPGGAETIEEVIVEGQKEPEREVRLEPMLPPRPKADLPKCGQRKIHQAQLTVGGGGKFFGHGRDASAGPGLNSAGQMFWKGTGSKATSGYGALLSAGLELQFELSSSILPAGMNESFEQGTYWEVHADFLFGGGVRVERTPGSDSVTIGLRPEVGIGVYIGEGITDSSVIASEPTLCVP